MKKVLFFFTLAAVIASCGNNNNQATTTTDAASGTNSGYAYTIAHPDQWEWGDKNNIKIALNGLKAFENGNVSEALKDYADTILVQMDGFEGRMSKDNLTALFLKERSAIKQMKIVMNDFESVKSKDGRSEYVSLWYKQLWEDQTGKIDSIECMDDLSFKNGKINLFNEKIRRFPGGIQ